MPTTRRRTLRTSRRRPPAILSAAYLEGLRADLFLEVELTAEETAIAKSYDRRCMDTYLGTMEAGLREAVHPQRPRPRVDGRGPRYRTAVIEPPETRGGKVNG